MRKQEDIDKTLAALILLKEMWPELKKLKTAEKWYDKLILVFKVLLGKLKRIISVGKSVVEIGEEVIDIDRNEAEKLFTELSGYFGGTDKAKGNIKKIITACGDLNQGIYGLIQEAKEKENKISSF